MATPDVVLPTDTFDDSSIFENKSGLAEDMRFLASMPELCDVTFLVGDTREPVCAVKAVLCARSRYCNLQLSYIHLAAGILLLLGFLVLKPNISPLCF